MLMDDQTSLFEFSKDLLCRRYVDITVTVLHRSLGKTVSVEDKFWRFDLYYTPICGNEFIFLYLVSFVS